MLKGFLIVATLLAIALWANAAADCKNGQCATRRAKHPAAPPSANVGVASAARSSTHHRAAKPRRAKAAKPERRSRCCQHR